MQRSASDPQDGARSHPYVRLRSTHADFSRDSAFTLIELLVVVGIIAILAAFAIPNIQESITRARVSRVRADHHAIATALEAYHVDHNVYPEDYAEFRSGANYGMGRLTSPVAYMSTVPRDVFGGYIDQENGRRVISYSLGTEPDEAPARWMLTSAGPNQFDETSPVFRYPGFSTDLWDLSSGPFRYLRYDPTNGTTSDGDIIRVSDSHVE